MTTEASLLVDFSWKKWGARIVDPKNPNEPLYFADFKSPLSQQIIYKRMSDGEIVGKGRIHAVKIDADYELHGHKGTLKALKRMHTSYTHLSYNYSNKPGEPIAMTWSSAAGFKTWDFTCLDENQLPVARFTAHSWAVHKIGNIEFMGPKAHDRACQEEILTTGVTLYYTMLLRVNNIFNLVGSVIAKPGPLDKEASMRERKLSNSSDETEDQRVYIERQATMHEATVAGNRA